MRKWRAAVDDDPAGAAARIKSENPKYVLREWMLVEAYTAAKVGWVRADLVWPVALKGSRFQKDLKKVFLSLKKR